ncbi:MAG: hypothetical protein SWY16_17520 [Cyanobacteriota bacterium]|nr:hypothetical protein [Cyanobacteriota bacterium]
MDLNIIGSKRDRRFDKCRVAIALPGKNIEAEVRARSLDRLQ